MENIILAILLVMLAVQIFGLITNGIIHNRNVRVWTREADRAQGEVERAQKNTDNMADQVMLAHERVKELREENRKWALENSLLRKDLNRFNKDGLAPAILVTERGIKVLTPKWFEVLSKLQNEEPDEMLDANKIANTAAISPDLGPEATRKFE